MDHHECIPSSAWACTRSVRVSESNGSCAKPASRGSIDVVGMAARNVIPTLSRTTISSADSSTLRVRTGKLYCAVVLDAFSRRVVGWSIADHIRSELVVDALQMAIWRRQPSEHQTVAHSDHGSQYTSWAFGRRLRSAGLLGSMGSIGDCYDNSVAESFFGTLQLELLDEHHWQSREQLALAIFDWIEAWYNPRRRHSYCNMLSPIDYETATAA